MFPRRSSGCWARSEGPARPTGRTGLSAGNCSARSFAPNRGRHVPTGHTLDPASLRTHAFHRILLIKLSAVGDVIHTIPVLHKLRRRYPAARIDWLLRPQIAELIGHHPAITNVLPFARREWERPWRAGWRALRNMADLVGEMRSTRYELAIDLQ